MKLQKVRTIFNKNVNGFLSLIFPKPCLICANELSENQSHFCFKCIENLHFTDYEKYAEHTPADELFWGRVKTEQVYSCLFFEKGNSTQTILHSIKYKEGKELGIYMGEIMGKRIKNRLKYATIDAIVPIPLHSKKQFQRGFNQSLLIAEGLSNELQTPVVEGIYRKSHHDSQTKKNRFERWDNVKSIFQGNAEELNKYKHVVVVDDVLTTGATLESAAKTILQAVPEIKVSLMTVAIAK